MRPDARLWPRSQRDDEVLWGAGEDPLPAGVLRVPVGVADCHGSLCSDKAIVLTVELPAESLMPLALKKAL